jgi:DNA repair exonuclease SbcCD nuclease subunit
MKFLHLSDTHLGKTNYKLKEREEDFYKAFKQCVDIALREKVDFVVHTGDLFDEGNPSHKAIIQAIRQLSRLKNKGVPVFVIAGSHDISVDETVISILEEIGLVTNLSRPEYYEVDDKIVMKGLFYKNVFLCGVAGRQANIREIFEKLEKNPEASKADYKVFMFHHTISDISTMFMDVPSSALPKGFDYYAGGHWHTAFTAKHGTGIIQYAGSTEYTDVADMETPQKKQVLIVDTETREIKPVFLKTRYVIVERIDCEGITPNEATLKCLSLIKPSESAMLIFRLEGRLGEGNKNTVDRQAIREKAREQGYLHCKIYVSELLNPDEARKRRVRSARNVEEDYLKAKGYSQKEIGLARVIIELLGKNLRKEDLEKATQKVVEEFEK